MPRIRITESDLTTNKSDFAREITVYVPYISSTATVCVKLYEAAAAFKADYFKTETSDTEATSSDTETTTALDSRHYALALLEHGCKVLFDVMTAMPEDSEAEKGFTEHVSLLSNKNSYDIDFLIPGIDSVNCHALNKMLALIAASRKDCVALLDPVEYDKKVDGADTTVKIEKAKDAVGYFDDLFSAMSTSGISSDDDSAMSMKEDPAQIDKYCASAWAPVKADIVIDNVAYSGKILPGSFDQIMAIAESVNDGNSIWLAPAGVYRGVMPFDDIKTTVDLSDADVDVMQTRSKANHSVNPIQNIRGWGVRIWGDRTLYKPTGDKAKDGLTDYLYASSFLTVRILSNKVKKAVWDISKKYTFEQNTDVLWINFKAEIRKVLEEMKNNSGVSGYKIERKSTDERAKLGCKIKIVPILPVEDFSIGIELNDSGDVEITEEE